jgi:hypothetical protein
MSHTYVVFLVVYKKDLAHFRTIQARHQQMTSSNEFNKDKNTFKANLPKKIYPSDIQFELDAYKRPQQKIALLCGSPGAGVRSFNSDRIR